MHRVNQVNYATAEDAAIRRNAVPEPAWSPSSTEEASLFCPCCGHAVRLSENIITEFSAWSRHAGGRI